MPHRLRSADLPLGLDGLSLADLNTSQLGNLLSKRAQSLMLLAEQRGLPAIEENPGSSYLWKVHGKLKHTQPTYQSVMLDQCAFDSASKKHTRLDGCHVDLTALAITCSGRKCQFTQLKHQRLSGTSKGVFATTGSAKYPKRFADAIADAIGRALARSKVRNLWSRFGGIPGHCTG